MRRQTRKLVRYLSVGLAILPQTTLTACTMSISSPERPEIEIEVEFEDYNDRTDRVFYKIEVEADVVPPGQTTQCSCGIGFGTTDFSAPASFDVYGAYVGLRSDEGDNDFDLDAFAGFEGDSNVSDVLTNLPGFVGATAHGFSLDVNPFNLPNAGVGDKFVLSFLIGFDPDDFDEVNGNLIQFAAGSNEPGHPLSVFQGYQQTLRLPSFRIYDCDFNSDIACDSDDLDALLSLGPIANGIPRVDATEIYDLDGDDSIDLGDVDEWLKKAASVNGFKASYKYGDANLDGTVSAADLNAVGLNWNSPSTQWSDGDFNGDGEVDSADLNRLALNWNKAIPTSAVPEPSAHGLMVVLIIGLAIGRRRMSTAK